MRVQSSETISNFRGLLVWQKSRELVKNIYRVTKLFPKEELYGLTSQMRRAAISIMSNIAEGSSKRSTREFIRFINISYGSLAELEAQLIIAEDLLYIESVETQIITDSVQEIGRMLNSLQNGLNRKLNSELSNSQTLKEDA